jgi:hypothetical protein
MMEKAENIEISSFELSNRLYIFNYRFSSLIENAADEIIEKSEDPIIRRNALLWKMNAIPAAQEAIFRADPMAALIEISVFSIQMELFFMEESGRELFGPWQSIAVEASQTIEDELIQIWKYSTKSGELKQSGREALYQWARKNPIETISFSHRSISDTLVAAYSNVDFGLQESIGDIAVGIYDIRERLTYYTSMLPKQARWQAEYLIDEKLQGEEVERALDNLTRITDVIELSPELILDLQSSTLKELSKERIAILIALRQERYEVMEEISRQRQESIQRLEDLMINLSAEMLTQTTVSVENVIDHFFWRMAQLLLVAGVLVVIVIAVFRYFPPPRRG